MKVGSLVNFVGDKSQILGWPNINHTDVYEVSELCGLQKYSDGLMKESIRLYEQPNGLYCYCTDSFKEIQGPEEGQDIVEESLENELVLINK